jgi:hypothetical protein
VNSIKPHIYCPDYQAIGDCRICGHRQNVPWHQYMPTYIYDKTFMNVAHDDIEDYLLLGWVMRDFFMNSPREHYAVCMEWLCACKPRTLKKGSPSDQA